MTRRASLNIHIHEQPLITGNLIATRKVIEGGELEADPTQILYESLHGYRFGMTVETDDEARAGKVGYIAEFEKRHQPEMC
jgi:hypothetical protein